MIRRVNCEAGSINNLSLVWGMSEDEEITDLSYSIDRQQDMVKSATFDGSLTQIILEGGLVHNEYRLNLEVITSLGRTIKQDLWVYFQPAPKDEQANQAGVEKVEVILG